MLVMFAVGTMNVVWMAALGVLMTIEKLSITPHFSRAVGVAFVAIGLAMIVLAMAGLSVV
jgi:predicted metal-binding membrane protein